MTIEPVTNLEAVTYVTPIFEASKNAVLWMKHSIEFGFTSYVIPAAAKLGDLAIQFFGTFQNFAQTSPWPLAALIGGVIILSVAAFKYADNKAIENDDFAKNTFQVLGAVSLISAVALTSLGMVSVLV